MTLSWTAIISTKPKYRLGIKNNSIKVKFSNPGSTLTLLMILASISLAPC
jgi:hypothetical protein